MMGGRKKMREFTWGDSVCVKKEAPSWMRPGEAADVVGILDIETEAQAREFAVPLGSKMYTIEFGDGSDVEIPEAWIEADET
jgi:hypothetical protein